ncbi:MAG: PAS domain S-box protein [Methylocystaceae bacterium]
MDSTRSYNRHGSDGTINEYVEKFEEEIKEQAHAGQWQQNISMELANLRLRKFLQEAPIALAMTCGPVMNYVNTNYLKIFGYESMEQLSGTLLLNQVAPQCQETMYQYIRSQGEGDFESIDYETLAQRKDGSQFPVRIQIGRVIFGDEYAYLVGVQDISERNRNRRALAESEEKYRTLMENLDIGVLRIDPQGNILAVNSTLAHLVGFTSVEEALQVNILDFYQHPKEREDFLKRTFMENNVMHRELKLKKVDDGANWIASIKARLHRDQLGNMAWLDVVVDDVTEAKRVEEEMIRARMAAESASLAKSQFLSNMSHELRTPLNIIFGYSQLLSRDENLTVEQKEYIELINKSGEHLLGLINEILDLSKIEAGQLDTSSNTFDLYGTLINIDEMFRMRTEAKGLRMMVDLDTTLPRYIKADERKLRQVLINILGNAIKFTDEGTVILRAYGNNEDARSSSWPRKVIFEVEDTGSGLTSEEIQDIFNPFIQSAGGRKLSYGTGLGLTISRSYIQIMGGDIQVESWPGKGSLFRWSIQAGAPDKSKTILAADRRKVLRLVPGQTKIRILVVEDEELSRSFLKRLLQKVGFEVREAENGREALTLFECPSLFEQWQPDLILMDICMPVMSGEEATQRIKATPLGRQTIIIALTASAFKEDRAKMLDMGCDDFIHKPLTEKVLFNRIARHLGVEYLYQDDKLQNDESAHIDLKADWFAGLSVLWIENFRYTVITGDTNSMLQMLDELPKTYDLLRAVLKTLIDKYQLDIIIAVLETVKGEQAFES